MYHRAELLRTDLMAALSQEILDEIAALDAESAEVLATIRGLL